MTPLVIARPRLALVGSLKQAAGPYLSVEAPHRVVGLGDRDRRPPHRLLQRREPLSRPRVAAPSRDRGAYRVRRRARAARCANGSPRRWSSLCLGCAAGDPGGAVGWGRNPRPLCGAGSADRRRHRLAHAGAGHGRSRSPQHSSPGLAPALVSMQRGIAAALKAGVREGTHQRSGVRAGLVIFQVSLSLVLLVGAGLLCVRSRRCGRCGWASSWIDRCSSRATCAAPRCPTARWSRCDIGCSRRPSRIPRLSTPPGQQRSVLEHVEPVALRRWDRLGAPAGRFTYQTEDGRLLRYHGDAHPAGTRFDSWRSCRVGSASPW